MKDSPLTAGRPADTSFGVSDMIGLSPRERATAARPIEVAMPMGMPNHARPPSKNALTYKISMHCIVFHLCEQPSP